MSERLPQQQLDAHESPIEIPRIEHDFLHLDNMDHENLERYFDYLQRNISDPSRFMEKGGSGSVFNVNDSICIKMIEDRQMLEERRAREEEREPFHLDLGNRPFVEAHIQEHMGGLVVGGVRSPQLVQYIRGETWHGILMERLNAVNLQWVLNGKAPLPETFEKNKFLQSLGDYLDATHKEKKIYHGDLFPRNVMIHNETGDARVIDWGRAGQLKDTHDPSTEKDWIKYDELDATIMAL
jgi:tRNA A-37 threonylcarbamoyl transferase component Bud32